MLFAFAIGFAFAATSAASAALLLYTAKGFLGTAGFLISLGLGALALGLWVGAQPGSQKRRTVAIIVVYAMAAVFASFYWADPAFARTGFGSALGAFFLMAYPAYGSGLAYRLNGRADSHVYAFLGAAIGILISTSILIPRAHPSVIFVLAAAVLLVAALLEARPTPQTMSTSDFSLTGKAAVVTGVGDPGQLGFAVAERLQQAGAQVCSFGLTDGDLTNEDDVARLIAIALERLGKIDILVNVAGGLSVIKPLADTTNEEWERETTRNAKTAFLMSRAALPALRATRGSIINFASPAGSRAVANLGAYSAAKAGVIALTRALALEEKSNGVRANAIAPGMIDTAQNRKSVSDPASVKWVSREQVSNVVIFLASEAAGAVTGETIEVLGEGIQ